MQKIRNLGGVFTPRHRARARDEEVREEDGRSTRAPAAMGDDLDARIAALESELANDASSSSDDDSDDEKVATAEPPMKKTKQQADESSKLSSTASMFSVHAGQTVHFSGRKPGDPKPPRKGKRKVGADGEANEAPPISFRCDLCNISCNSEELLEEHLDGRRHAEMKASEKSRAAGLYCHCCAMGFTGKDQLSEHLAGGRHRQMASAGAGGAGRGKGGGKGKGNGKGKGKGDGGGRGKGRGGWEGAKGKGGGKGKGGKGSASGRGGGTHPGTQWSR